ncbi:MAG: ADP-forming succinate--CoA ligase subunit beta [Parachlamydiaceae bacterium]|nr:ADP-forming succinate--CoA ligase subunit beta [Parachlamydiaceae bacterium]
MNLHEYQAKLIFENFGIPVPQYYVVSTLQEVEYLISSHQLETAVLKVQIHAGGRGKAGGVKIAKNGDEILQYASELLGKKIINNQTGPAGIVARQIMITPPVDIKKEYYLGVVIDRQNARGVLIASQEGGLDIEEVAKNAPGKVLYIPIPLDGQLKKYHLLRLANFMGWFGTLAEKGKLIANALVKVFVEKDATLVEINPLVLTNQEELIAIDAKISIDDNALFRQTEIKSFYDPTQFSPSEARAHENELAYVALEGNIGCMVNGAGLAMATMDIIQYYGGRPANFLDIGGGASQEKITEGFKILLSDQHVKAILINIFGGIMNCGTLAKGLIAAANELNVNVPLIVRMEGTNVEQGRELLKQSKLNFVVTNSLEEAAQKVVDAAKSKGGV